MTAEAFAERYCIRCDRRCDGIFGEVSPTCAEYKRYFPYGENTTICGEDGCDGCFLRYGDNMEACKAEARRKGF